MRTNCALLFADLFFHADKADFMADQVQKKKWPFKLSSHFISDVLSLSKVRVFTSHLYQRTLKDNTGIKRSVLYLDLLLRCGYLNRTDLLSVYLSHIFS